MREGRVQTYLKDCFATTWFKKGCRFFDIASCCTPFCNSNHRCYIRQDFLGYIFLYTSNGKKTPSQEEEEKERECVFE